MTTDHQRPRSRRTTCSPWVPATAVGVIFAMVGAFGLPAQSKPDEASVDRAAIVRWHEQMRSDGAVAREARKNLIAHSAAAAPYLIEQLKRDGANRNSLIYLMGDLSAEAVPALCAEAAKDTSPVRAEVFEVLSRVVPTHGAPLPVATDAVMRGLRSEDPAVLKWVFLLLGGMRPFAELHLSDPAPIGPRCALALAGDPRAPVAAVVEATLDHSAFVRSRAAEYLQPEPGRSAVTALCNLITDEDAAVRESAWLSVANRFAADPESNEELQALLAQRLSLRIGGPTRETQDELMQRRNLVACLHPAGTAALSLYLDVVDLPVSPHFWVAEQTNAVREQALLGLHGLGVKARRAVPLLKRGLEHDAMSLHLRKLALRVLRAVEMPAEEESAVCWQAYERALTATPLSGLGDGYLRHFQKMRVELVEEALDGLTSRGAALHAGWDLQQELARAAEGDIAPTVAIAAMVRTAWQRPEVQALALRRLQAIGDDAHAGEATLIHALSAREAGEENDPSVLAHVLAKLVKYATHHRPPGRANHYLHKPSLVAIERLAPSLTSDDRRRLIEELVTKGNVKGAPDEALSRLCVKVDAKLAAEFCDRGMMGRRISGNLLHVAPEMFVADLDAEDRGGRSQAAQRLRSYGVANEATHAEFAKLLRKPTLRQPREVFAALTRLQPPPAFVELLRPWLLRAPQAYEAMGAIRPTPMVVLEELLQVEDSSEQGVMAAYGRIKHLLSGMRQLGPVGAVYVPKLVELAGRVPLLSPLIAETLPYLGVDGVRAFLDIDPASRPFEGFAIANQMHEGVDTNTRVAILSLLLARGKPVDGLDRIIERASHSKEPRIRVASQLLLANMAPDSDQAIEAMLQALSGSSQRLRYHAVKGLAKSAHNPRVRAYLFWLRQDDDERVAKVATDALR